jgi:general secretion pathway protein A
MNQKLLALYGLKWNPFTPEVPTEALYVPPKVENFCWRIEQAHLREGGFALIHGEPGSGKSVVMRLLAERLARLADLSVGVIHHPQSNLSDFYRELGGYLLDLHPRQQPLGRLQGAACPLARSSRFCKPPARRPRR